MGLTGGTLHYEYRNGEILYYLNEQECPICGKRFEPTNLWVYRDNCLLVCSWTCLRKYRATTKRREEKGRNGRRHLTDEDIEFIKNCLNDGMRQCDICRITGISSSLISQHVKKIREGIE